MSREEIIRRAFLRYHGGEITQAELQRAVAQWRPKGGGRELLDGVELNIVIRPEDRLDET